jgi:rare lipoprotein A
MHHRSSAAALVAVAAALAALFTVPAAEAKTPGHEYCFLKTCHRVKSLDETAKLIGVTTTLKASFYDDPKNDRYNPSNLTSSGETFRADRADNAASPIYPDGTKLLVWHPASRKALVVRINNAGPYWGDRKLDLSRAAADMLGFRKSGVASVHVRVIYAPSKAEATYKRGRTYPASPGYLGQFASLEAAAATSGVVPAPSRDTRWAAAGPRPDLALSASDLAGSAYTPMGLLDGRDLTPPTPQRRRGGTPVILAFR